MQLNFFRGDGRDTLDVEHDGGFDEASKEGDSNSEQAEGCGKLMQGKLSRQEVAGDVDELRMTQRFVSCGTSGTWRGIVV